MSNLEYKVGGRTVSQGEFMKNIKDSALELAHKAVKEQVSRVRCPVHGQHPTNLRATGGSGGNIGYEFTACCEQLKAAVAKTFE